MSADASMPRKIKRNADGTPALGPNGEFIYLNSDPEQLQEAGYSESNATHTSQAGTEQERRAAMTPEERAREDAIREAEWRASDGTSDGKPRLANRFTAIQDTAPEYRADAAGNLGMGAPFVDLYETKTGHDATGMVPGYGETSHTYGGNTGAMAITTNARSYGLPGEPMAYDDPRRGGNIQGMDYSRTAPPPMVRPQGRNTMLPQYGTDPYMPVGQGAPSAGAMQTYTPRTTSAPMPPRQKEPPRRPTSTPNTPHQYPSTPWLGPPQRPGYTAPTLNAPQQVAPGTPGAPSVSVPSAPPAQLGDPAAIAQQQALATMALGGSAPAPGLGGTTTIKPPTFRF